MAASCSAGEEVANLINYSKRSKRSKRILAARAFLKSITLDGGSLKEESRAARPDRSSGDIPAVQNGPNNRANWTDHTIEDDRELISALPSKCKAQLHHSISVASTNVFEEGTHARVVDDGRVPKSRSYVDTSSVSSKVPRPISPRIHAYEAQQYHARSTKHMLGKRSVLCELVGMSLVSNPGILWPGPGQTDWKVCNQTDNFVKCTRKMRTWPLFLNNKLLSFLEMRMEDLT